MIFWKLILINAYALNFIFFSHLVSIVWIFKYGWSLTFYLLNSERMWYHWTKRCLPPKMLCIMLYTLSPEFSKISDMWHNVILGSSLMCSRIVDIFVSGHDCGTTRTGGLTKGCLAKSKFLKPFFKCSVRNTVWPQYFINLLKCYFSWLSS